MICALNNNLQEAIQILKNLKKGSDTSRNETVAVSLVLMVLSKTVDANDKKSKINNYQNILDKISNPYLKLLFAHVLESDNLKNLIVSMNAYRRLFMEI